MIYGLLASGQPLYKQLYLKSAPEKKVRLKSAPYLKSAPEKKVRRKTAPY